MLDLKHAYLKIKIEKQEQNKNQLKNAMEMEMFNVQQLKRSNINKCVSRNIILKFVKFDEEEK